MYRGADNSLARPTSRCILLDGENISFDINSTNIPPIIIKIRYYFFFPSATTCLLRLRGLPPPAVAEV